MSVVYHFNSEVLSYEKSFNAALIYHNNNLEERKHFRKVIFMLNKLSKKKELYCSFYINAILSAALVRYYVDCSVAWGGYRENIIYFILVSATQEVTPLIQNYK